MTHNDARELGVDESDLITAQLSEHGTLAGVLRNETAQTLAYVLIKLGALLELEDSGDIRRELTELREAVRPELHRVLQLIAALDQQH